jgi:death-on-curing protein
VQPLFLSVDRVLRLHDLQLQLFGGASGVRDLGLLESAIANAEATFDGVFLQQDLFEMAAAYLYGICRNHPFVDGNKRSAVSSALVFLEMNDIRIECDDDDLYDVVMATAEGRITKSEIAAFLREHATEHRD